LNHEDEQATATFSLWNVVDEAISNLYAGYFVMVMATGIVSIASYLLEILPIAWVLFQINKIAIQSCFF